MADSAVYDLTLETSLPADYRLWGQKTSAATTSTSVTPSMLGGLVPVAITDADVTMTAGSLYWGDISGWATADRTYTLPATAAVGDRVGVMLTVGDATYELLITANTGDTLNAVAGGTEWSRLFITGEVVIMRCVVANATWIVEYDGRIPCKAKGEDNAGQTLTNDTMTTIEMPLSVIDVGDILDTTNDYFAIRRAGNYVSNLFARCPTMADQQWLIARFYDVGGVADIHYGAQSFVSIASGTTSHYIQGSAVETLAVGDTVTWQVKQNTGADKTASTTEYIRCWQSIVEIL